MRGGEHGAATDGGRPDPNRTAPLGAGLSVVWKNGETLGYSSYIGFVPHAHSGVVLLANSAQCPVTRAGYQILATLNGQAAGEPNVPEEGN
jgi:hypothetical protein